MGVIRTSPPHHCSSPPAQPPPARPMHHRHIPHKAAEPIEEEDLCGINDRTEEPEMVDDGRRPTPPSASGVYL